MVKLEAYTFLNSLDSDEETLWRCLIVSVTEEKVEAVMTFEPTECSVFVKQAVHLHIVLRKVLTCVQVSESSFCLHTVTCEISTCFKRLCKPPPKNKTKQNQKPKNKTAFIICDIT